MGLYTKLAQLVSPLHIIINVRGPLCLEDPITLPLAFMQWGTTAAASAAMLRDGEDDRPVDSTLVEAMKNA